MIRRILLLLSFLLLGAIPAAARNSIQGWCETGAQNVTTSGLTSTSQVQASFPKCYVNVLVHGGGVATIFKDNAGTALANPFESDTNGHWQFYANDGRYDVTMTASPDQPFMPTTTYPDIEICDYLEPSSPCGGGGAGGPITWYYNNTLVGTQPGGDFDDKLAGGTNVSIVATNDAANSRVHYVFSSVEQFQNAGTLVGAEPILNLTAGSNVTFSTFADDPVNKRVNVTINSSGGGGGSTPNQAVSFTNQTTVTLATGVATANLVTVCYDTATPANQIWPSNTTVSAAGTAVWTFLVPQSGYCVVNTGSGGGGGGGGAVTSVFGRTGTVIAQTGDYTFSQISGIAAESQLPASTLFGDQNFTAGAHTFDFSAATSFKLPVGTGYTTSAIGQIGYDSSAANWHAFVGASDRLLGIWSASPSSGGCVQALVSGGSVFLTTPSASACNTAVGANTALSNLAAVAINSPLLPATAAGIPLGSNALPVSNVFIGASANKSASFVSSGLSTNRTYTFPDASGTLGVVTGSPTNNDGVIFSVSGGVTTLVDLGTPPAKNTLSNLGVTAVNADILPASAGVINVGNGTVPLADVTSNEVDVTGTPGEGITFAEGALDLTNCLAGQDSIGVDSVTHRLQYCNNGSGFGPNAWVVYRTQAAAGNTSISATTLLGVPAAPSIQPFRFSGYIDETIVGSGGTCASNTTVALNLIFTDPNTASTTTLTVGTLTIVGAGTVGTTNLAVNGVSFLAKPSTNVQFSTTFTNGNCTTQPTVQVIPLLEAL